MKKKQDLSAFVIIFIIIGAAASSLGSKEEDHSNAPEPSLVTESVSDQREDEKVVLNNSAPKMTDLPDDDGIGETNLAEDEREEVREENPSSQALPQPIAETLETVEDSTVSKYKGMVTIRSASGPRESDVDKEHIQLMASSGNEGAINVSNWKLRSAVTGRTIQIGTAERLFISGSSGAKETVSINPRGKVYILTGRSPIGSSFIVNKCSGYLMQFQTFHPFYYSQCPRPQDEILHYSKDPSIFIDNACMDYVERIGTCQIAVDIPISLSPTCQEAIAQEINYNACVNKHRNEEDFYTDDQRVYLKYSSELWRNDREIIELLDEDDLLVTFVQY